MRTFSPTDAFLAFDWEAAVADDRRNEALVIESDDHPRLAAARSSAQTCATPPGKRLAEACDRAFDMLLQGKPRTASPSARARGAASKASFEAVARTFADAIDLAREQFRAGSRDRRLAHGAERPAFDAVCAQMKATVDRRVEQIDPTRLCAQARAGLVAWHAAGGSEAGSRWTSVSSDVGELLTLIQDRLDGHDPRPKEGGGRRV